MTLLIISVAKDILVYGKRKEKETSMRNSRTIQRSQKILLGLVLFMFLYSFGCAVNNNKKQSTEDSTDNEKKVIVPKNKDKQGKKETSQVAELWWTEEMFREYSENQVAADEKYKGHAFFVRGVPSQIGYDNNGKIYVVLSYSPGMPAVCFFEDNQKDKVSKLKVTGGWDDTIVVKGKCEGSTEEVKEENNSRTIIIFNECNIVEDEPPVVQIFEETDGGAGPTKYFCLEKGNETYNKKWHDVSSNIYNSMDDCVSHMPRREPLTDEDWD